MHQLSLFPLSSDASSGLAGMMIAQPYRPCRCGSAEVVIGSSTRVHYGSLHCTGCGAFRGWLPGVTYKFLLETTPINFEPGKLITAIPDKRLFATGISSVVPW